MISEQLTGVHLTPNSRLHTKQRVPEIHDTLRDTDIPLDSQFTNLAVLPSQPVSDVWLSSRVSDIYKSLIAQVSEMWKFGVRLANELPQTCQ